LLLVYKGKFEMMVSKINVVIFIIWSQGRTNLFIQT